MCNPIYNYNMCVRASVRPTTVPRFNWLAEPARTVGFYKQKIPHKKSFVPLAGTGSDSWIPRPETGPDSRILQTKNPPQKIVCASCRNRLG